MFLLCFLLFLPLTAKALCSDHNDHQGDCINAAGCYYLSNSGNCTDCPSNTDATDIGYYCPQDGICADGTPSDNGRCQCPTPFNLSTLGNADIENCYADIDCIHKTYDRILQCKHYSNDSFWCPEDVSTYRIHIEPDGNCYTGTLNCGEFNSDCNGSPKNDVLWDYQNHQWMTAENNPTKCICEGTSDSDPDLHCIAKANKTTTQNAQYATQQISYDTINNYWCTECDSGYYVDAAYDLKSVLEPPVSGQTWCHVDENDPGGQYTVCKCTQVPKGSYLNTACPVFGKIETLADICPPNNCGAGKTTDNAGTIGNTCHYSPDTKFCDANGCFNITDADSGNWNWNH